MYTWRMKTVHVDDNHSGKSKKSTVYAGTSSQYVPEFVGEKRKNKSRGIPIHSLVKKIMAVEWAKAWGKSPYLKGRIIRESLGRGWKK